MRDSGMPPLASTDRREDPYYAHIPQLKTRLRDFAYGRRSGELRAIAESNHFRNWDTDMRYAPTGEVHTAWVEAWRDSAHRLVEQMDAY